MLVFQLDRLCALLSLSRGFLTTLRSPMMIHGLPLTCNLSLLSSDSVSTSASVYKCTRRVIRPWLGLKMIDLNELILAQLKERDPSFPDVKTGVLVPMVTPGSPADHAGFRPGDVVVEFDGKPVASINEVIDALGDQIGKPLKVVVRRANNVQTTLTVIPEEANLDI